MVNRAAQIILLAAFLTRSVIAADNPSPPHYRLGDTATADVVTPVALVVVDAEATESLRQQEAARIPVIYRFNPKSADEVEASFRAALTGPQDQLKTRLCKGLEK
jgi:hypothetical protein